MRDQTERIRGYFDGVAREYLLEREEQYSFVSQRELVLELLPSRLERILDIGCGPAVMESGLLERSGEVWGIDASAQMIAYGRARMLNHPERARCHLSVGDVEHLAFRDGYFDAALAMGVIEYLLSYDQALAEMHRVLRRSGVAVITVPSRVSAYHVSRESAEAVRGLAKRLLGRPPSGTRCFVTNRCVPRRLDRQLERAGFRRMEARFCNFIFYPLHELHSGASQALNRKLSGLANRELGAWLGTQYVVKAQKL